MSFTALSDRERSRRGQRVGIKSISRMAHPDTLPRADAPEGTSWYTAFRSGAGEAVRAPIGFRAAANLEVNLLSDRETRKVRAAGVLRHVSGVTVADGMPNSFGRVIIVKPEAVEQAPPEEGGALTLRLMEHRVFTEERDALQTMLNGLSRQCLSMEAGYQPTLPLGVCNKPLPQEVLDRIFTYAPQAIVLGAGTIKS